MLCPSWPLPRRSGVQLWDSSLFLSLDFQSPLYTTSTANGFPRPRQVQVKFKLGSSWKTYTCVWSYWVVLFFNAHCYVINNIRTLIIIGWGFPVSITCAVKKPWSGQLTFNFIRMLLTENAEKKESDNHWFLALFSVQILSPEASRGQHFFLSD